MVKAFSKIFIIVLILIIGFISFFSLVGFETTSLNKQIKENLKKIDSKLDVQLNDVKIVLDIINLNINAKTLGPTIFYENKSIDIELIKSDLSIFDLLNKKFLLSNLFISTKSVKLKDVIAFFRAIKKDNKTQLYILENFISKGYLIADVNLNFDKQGKIKDNFKVSGYIKDGSINLLNKRKIDRVDLIFETKNKNVNIEDLKFSYEKINFTSKKIEFINHGKFVNIEGQINNDEVNLSEKILSNLVDPLFNISFKNIKFDSENKFFLKINNKFKIKDYEIKSLLNINELTIKNDVNIKNIFPNLQSEIKAKNHKTEIILKKDNLSINGNGDFLVQKNYDQTKYKINKIKDQYLFNLDYMFAENPVNFDFLNYKSDDKLKTSLKFSGKFVKDKFLNLEKIKFENGSDFIGIDNLELTKDFRISNIKSANFNYTDKQNKKNIFQIKDNKESYVISGKVFNASKLIDDLIFGDSKNENFFSQNFNLDIDIKEVYLHDKHIVYDAKGYLKFKENNIFDANLTSQFNKNEKISFTIISDNDQKVTTLFSDQAKPFVKKFDFIKGFDKGSLDFYSVKSKDSTNSKLKIYEFKLKELPVLTKILTLASLQGVADLLSGEGIGFSEFEMSFENKKKLMTINEIYAIGPAISILMDGYIEKNKLVSLRGTLVPATTINKVIGSIPIIGDILVGKKTGEGVFGVSFKIKGPPKNLETSVNPIKTLTPRFITRTLEKIKKN